MILACHGIQKSFGEHLIVRDGSFHIEDHEKAALVGPNGAGKSTLLKMIVGESAPDDGNVILTKGKTLGYLAQHQEMQSGNTSPHRKGRYNRYGAPYPRDRDGT